jgi:hypothetical protein
MSNSPFLLHFIDEKYDNEREKRRNEDVGKQVFLRGFVKVICNEAEHSWEQGCDPGDG